MTWRDALCASVLGMLLLATHWFTVNTASSVPLGLYRYVRESRPLVHGTIVYIPAVPFGRQWPDKWLGLLKPVAAVAGEEVCVTQAGLTVRGEDYGAVHQWDTRGTALPVFWGCHVVDPGSVFLASKEPRSLDGRYLGMTPIHKTLRAVPVWTWE
jgi:type IV secretory pathway protease TraF